MNSNIVIVAEHRDLAEIARTIKTELIAVQASLGKALEHAKRIGDALIRAKGDLPHGEFTPWVQANCSFSERTARNYMKISQHWLTVKATATSIREAIRLLNDENLPTVATVEKVETVSTFGENGSELPFSLPPIGMGMLGVVAIGVEMMDWIYIVIEAVDDQWFRSAIAGAELSYDKRGCHRDYLPEWLEVKGHDAEFWQSVHWFPPRPVAPANNPIRHELPWTYESPA